MSLPKGIYENPAIRAAWIEERQPLLEHFDRLVAAGTPPKQAARQVGSTPGGIRQMRASVERLEGENYRLTRQAKAERIDLGLALLSLANPPGEERQVMSAYDIAAWCGCTHAAIQSIERRALRKLQRRFAALLRGQVIHGDFAEADTTLLRPAHPLAAAA